MQEAQDNFLKAEQRMKKYTDKGRWPLEFQVRDKVLLKLIHRFGGSLEVRVCIEA